MTSENGAGAGQSLQLMTQTAPTVDLWLGGESQSGCQPPGLKGTGPQTTPSESSVLPVDHRLVLVDLDPGCLALGMAMKIEDLIERFYTELWNQWDDTVVEQVLADDFVFRGSLGTQTYGPDGWRSYRDTIRQGAPDFHNEVLELVVAEQRAAARLSYTGHHTGTLAGIPATGRRFEYAGAAFFTCAEGKLTSAWILGDLDGLRRQLLPDTNSADSTQ
jgi:steroid delta-isomerase-like uncharacterized protein